MPSRLNDHSIRLIGSELPEGREVDVVVDSLKYAHVHMHAHLVIFTCDLQNENAPLHPRSEKEKEVAELEQCADCRRIVTSVLLSHVL